MRTLCFAATALAAVAMMPAATGNRQVTKNERSPSAETSVALGDAHITIEYNAPSSRDSKTGQDRQVEGGLIPYDSIYRMGADAATTMTTDADITIGTVKVPKGVHTLYLQANASGNWQLVINKQTKQWGTVYNQDQDLGRTAMTVSKLPSKVERFKITLTGKGATAGELSVEWSQTKATVPIKLG